MVESVNRYGVLPEEPAPAPLRSATIPDPEPEADPTIVHHHPHVYSDSEDPKHPTAKASPLTPTNPVRSCPTPSIRLFLDSSSPVRGLFLDSSPRLVLGFSLFLWMS